jgi:hypothetical protein
MSDIQQEIRDAALRVRAHGLMMESWIRQGEEIRRLRAMLPEQYAAGFRDGMAAAKPLDASAPVIVGPDAG